MPRRMRSSLAVAEAAKKPVCGILPFVRSGAMTNWLAAVAESRMAARNW